MNKKFIAGMLAVPTFLFFVISAFIISDSRVYNAAVIDRASIMPYEDYVYMTTDSMMARVDNHEYYVPKFFRTDLTSIPRAFWWLEAPYKGNFIYPAIVHDYLYGCPNGLKRKEIDDLFLSLLISEKTSKIDAYLMYVLVRLFGHNAFFDGGVCDEIIAKEIEQDDELYQQYDIED